MKTGLVIAMGICVVVLSSACGSTNTAATTMEVTETTQAPPEATPQETTTDSSGSKPTVVRQVGETGIDEGLAFRVTSIEPVSQIQLDQYSDPPVARPTAGATLVVAKVVVINRGSRSVYPFCGGAGAVLVDTNDRNFDQLHEIAIQIPGNPTCSSDLQPGFQDTYTLVFKTPKSAQIAGLAVWNSTC